MVARRSTNVRRSGQLDRAAPCGQPRPQTIHGAAVVRNLAYDVVRFPGEGVGKLSQPSLQVNKQRSFLTWLQRPTHKRYLRLGTIPPHRDQATPFRFKQPVGDKRPPQFAPVVEVEYQVLIEVKAQRLATETGKEFDGAGSRRKLKLHSRRQSPRIA